MANRPKLSLFGRQSAGLPQASPAGRTPSATVTDGALGHRAAEIREAQVMRALKGDLAARTTDYGAGATNINTSGNRWGEGEPVDIIAALEKLVETLPPAPFWVSSRIFAQNTFWRITTKRTDYLLAHPDAWRSADVALSRDQGSPCVPSGITSIDMQIIDLDTDAGRSRAAFHLDTINAMLGTAFAAPKAGAA